MDMPTPDAALSAIDPPAKADPPLPIAGYPPGLDVKDISSEEWREYEFSASDHENGRYTYTIAEPVHLIVGKTTHRVVDADGVAHCVPAPGFRGCVLRWKNKPGQPRVSF